MALRKTFCCLWTLGLCLVVGKSSLVPSITDPYFIDKCVSAHNEWRGKVSPPAANMKYMSWDSGLAKMAKAWANNCKFQHNSCLTKSYACHEDFEYVGENIWLSDKEALTPELAVASWYNETEFYDFDSLSCSKDCGHYTQVVWATSDKIGCAAAICPNLGDISTTIFVCNYGPAGNFANMAPYKKGASCSLCSKGEKCVQKLCKNPLMKPMGKAPQRIPFNLFSLSFILLRIF
ncbi:GLIPR1-like protein 1 isoform X2 [Carlito syrichta]|uniref:GLIPR1-like protein 1 isoform X2 n=1 Tax=Carlito syrichta TaxID=1868482 RepID=A0A3Q0DLS3_CARSF|nr:GLIPR1-like protein 1 isoform X2 [Carlito syrichta]